MDWFGYVWGGWGEDWSGDGVIGGIWGDRGIGR